MSNTDDKKNFELRIACRVALNGSVILSVHPTMEHQKFGTLMVENIAVSLLFDLECLTENEKYWHSINITKDPNHKPCLPVQIDSIKAEVVISNVAAELIDLMVLVDKELVQCPPGVEHAYIKLPNDPPDKYEKWQIYQDHMNEVYRLFNEHKSTAAYRELADKTYDALFNSVNRFISWVRTKRSQFWLQDLRLHPAKNFQHWPEGFGKVQELVLELNSKQLRWYPPLSPVTFNGIPEALALKADDLEQLAKFIETKERPNLEIELLANSYLLKSAGHDRVALTQSITALEVALNNFAKSPLSASLWSEQQLSRMGSLKTEIDHLGFSTTFSRLLPLIFNEEQVPTQTLKTCLESIETRNNIVHNGARSVKNIDEKLDAVKKMVEILQSYSDFRRTDS